MPEQVIEDCPFCGNIMIIERVGRNTFIPFCSKERCIFNCDVTYTSRENAIKAVNTREG